MKTTEKINMLKNAGFSMESIQLALTAVSISDPDCAYTALQDAGEFQAAEIVEILFFGSEEFFENLEPESDESEEDCFDLLKKYLCQNNNQDQNDTDITFNG